LDVETMLFVVMIKMIDIFLTK